MPYILYKSNGTKLATIADGSINNLISPLTFVGKNYAGYGEIINQNLVKLLENFANKTAPTTPLVGQLWFDAVNKRINVYDGYEFKALQSYKIALTAPNANNNAGDFFFNSAEERLYFYDGMKYILIGPNQSDLNGTSIVASTAIDTNLNSHYTLNFTVTDDTGVARVIAVASRDEFTVSAADPLSTQNFSKLKQGLTLPTSDLTKGISVGNTEAGDYYFWGTAATALGMVRSSTTGTVYHPSTDYFLWSDYSTAISSGLKIDNDYGLYVGSQAFRIGYNTPGSRAKIVNQGGRSIDFDVRYIGDTTSTVLTIAGNSLIPGTLNNENIDFYLGGESTPFAGLFVQAASIGGLSVTTLNVESTLTASGGLIGDIVGNVTGNLRGAWVTATNMKVALNIAASSLDLTGDITTNGVTLINPTSRFVGKLQGDVTGNITGNLNGYQVTATNILVNGILTANSIQLKNGNALTGNVVTDNIRTPGTTTLVKQPGVLDGAWSLVGSSSLTATYADLAERYEADALYGPGTVLILGGAKEVTMTTERASTAVAGIVSTNPAFKMNSEAGTDETHPYIALKGRVPCRVVGPIQKGELLVTSRKAGCAEAAQMGDSPNAVIGKALEDFEGSEGVIEVKI